ncbi:alpha-amylase family protein [Halomicroarcula limicola]|uniref:Alpha-amylase family protein n=1 Tax=Haloarcula limicola TaxID=1429915 RepID=A0A8J8C7K6_9EURY|nr:alpha-amylase family protein [Halomicroarcula limicola]MBV0923650.1 alpha-amylase family protein [Halomicroarcula limicola]
MTDHPQWYRDAVIYSLDVKTFADGNGDGIGDFVGLRDRLDYLDDLGVTCLWLLPFYPSPWRDNGYDVADYYGIDERLGTMGDFRRFLDEAHDRGMRVLADMVFNHTSTDHPWFQRARDGDEEYRDYYLWTDDPESAPDVQNIFPGEEDGVWTYDEAADAHYYHQFYHFQPDLNVSNPAVQDEIERVLRFWTEQGLDGFRVDAATPMIGPKGAEPVSIDDPHSLFRRMKSTVGDVDEETVLLAEADDEPAELKRYFGTGDEFDLLLSFVSNAHLVWALVDENADHLGEAFDRLPDYDEVAEHGQWANFLRNFDELNLGPLPRQEFDRAFERIGADPDTRLYGRGVRRRLAPLLDGDPDRIACATSLCFALPGTPIIVAGDEIGMGDELSLPGRDAVRTPIQWTDDPTGGFSTGDAETLFRPVVEGEYGPESVNVAAQSGEPDSLLAHVREIIATRKACPELSRGEQSVVETEDPAVFLHRSDWGETTLLTAHNVGSEPTTVNLDAPDDVVTHLLGPGEYSLDSDTVSIELGGYEYCWLRLGRPRTRSA